MSKIQVPAVRESIRTVLKESQEKNRKFTETIELQVGLKNYDPQRDKRFSGTVKLPNVPRPKMSVAILGDAHDCDRAKEIGIEFMSVEDLKKLNKNKKLIKKLAKKYDAFLASESLIKQIPRLLGPGLHKAGKFPTPVTHNDDLNAKADELRSTIKFQLKKVLCLGVAVGHVKMSEDELVANIMLSINFLVSLLKKNWQNVRSLYIKSTMDMRITTLDKGFCSGVLKEQKRIHNPFNSIHAAALCTFAETIGGLAVFSKLTDKDRAIVTRINMEYFKKARGLITATSQFNLGEISGQTEKECEVILKNEALDTVAKATVFWSINSKN
ncbi:ribosomal protein L1-like protein [Rhizophagus irregularis DAOM 181602=DAOM 197198]|uniref:Ribosomal protein n=1 Tax=Rhizophagus irregularis (strain DAOM 181602 / DAOM 197198 / MUCL 43194) TaxID=747089 RepID=A0A2P4Q7A1_RHIID|nr:ribosomal protein L1-like protein [Rhizophagus irregularis DAOM 181602=DAOM 197198]POG73523.1 ribosomal protein L1-like protein [Rhizophagus irregularis DAOM 181602=DAOM 197198]|eukprot:XP_025180389.1 ribosomal protein L1-like protein [Rhizophagus irregularis DAOM 181602=DAOM 197198]